ncbi:MAG: type-F conjugative transfer system pilin assembly protein TrbC [Syntrophales bacterium]
MRKNITNKIFVAIFIVLFSATCISALEMTTDDINSVLNRANDMQKRLTIPDNPNGKQGEELARESFEKFQSAEFQNRLKAESERIQKEIMGGAGQKKYYADTTKSAKDGLSNEQIYIFISSSMPASTIRNYVQDAAYLNDPNIILVLRGFVGGVKQIKPTLKFTRDVIKKDSNCTKSCDNYNVKVQVNPPMYSRYNIDRVPAILYVQGVLPKEAALLKSNNTEFPNWVIYGDASLETATEIFADKTKKESMRAMNRKLRRIDQ